MPTIIEHVTYETQERTDETLIDKFQTQINAFCLAQPGFLYRSISRNDKGIWHDIVYWEDMVAADAASQRFAETDVCKALVNVVKEGTLQMQHMQALSEAMSAPAQS